MSAKTGLAAVVVVYNISCADSVTCQALSRMEEPELSVLIYDNSTSDFGNRAFCGEKGWTYLGGSGNVGLSKAYNACIDHLKNRDFSGFLCLFDDDTRLDGSYFRLLREAAAGGGRIFVPLIRSAGKLLSPCRISKGHITRRFADEGEALDYRGDDLTAINSCMALAFSLFDQCRYDENIFLDGIDHTFLMKCKALGEKITVFPYRCDHDFSGDEMPPMQSALTRFRIYAGDYRYILRDDTAAYLLLVGKRALHLAVKYRSFSFLRILLGQGTKP